MSTLTWQGDRRSILQSLTTLRHRLLRGQKKFKLGPPSNKLMLLVLSIALVSWLTGCTNTIVKPLPYAVPIVLPSVLTNECYVSPPPTKYDLIHALDRYRVAGVTSEEEARFLLMTDHWLLQTDALGMCNLQLSKSREWINKHRDLEKPNENLRNPE